MRVLKWGAGAILAILLALFAAFLIAFGPANFARVALGIGQGFDHDPPQLPRTMAAPAILVFSKTNGFRDGAQIDAANAAIARIARARGWSTFATENAAVFNPEQLARFDAVVWNSVSGDVLTGPQRKAFRAWLEAGGGFVGLHGSGGDPQYAWKWYVDDLIGAQFIGHTFDPQFQDAVLVVEDRDHPATRNLPARWPRSDEWYSFATNPRAKGYRVLVRIDERTYSPAMKGMPFVKARDLRMGPDHPMVWVHCVGAGRAFYSALGHQASAYSEPVHLKLIEGAIAWAAGQEQGDCHAPQAPAPVAIERPR